MALQEGIRRAIEQVLVISTAHAIMAGIREDEAETLVRAAVYATRRLRRDIRAVRADADARRQLLDVRSPFLGEAGRVWSSKLPESEKA